MWSITSIYRQNIGLYRTFSEHDASCLEIVYLMIIVLGVVMPYFATLVDFVFSQYVKVGESMNVKERFIVATDHIILIACSFNLSYIAIQSGLRFYAKSAKLFSK